MAGRQHMRMLKQAVEEILHDPESDDEDFGPGEDTTSWYWSQWPRFWSGSNLFNFIWWRGPTIASCFLQLTAWSAAQWCELVVMCNVNILSQITLVITGQIYWERKAALPSPFTSGWLYRFIQKMHYSFTSCQLFLAPLSSFLAHLLAPYSNLILHQTEAKNLKAIYNTQRRQRLGDTPFQNAPGYRLHCVRLEWMYECVQVSNKKTVIYTTTVLVLVTIVILS